MANCPSCERDDFASEGAMRIHHTKAHGESIAKEIKKCEVCGEEFESYGSMKQVLCGDESCTAQYLSDVQRGEQVELVCENCGSERNVYPYYAEKFGVSLEFCRECQSDYFTSLPQEDHPRWSRVEIKCNHCGDVREVEKNYAERHNFTLDYCGSCEVKWRAEYFSGEEHPSWEEETQSVYYGLNWEEQSKKARKRDGYRCVVCGTDSDEYGHTMHVHHRIPFVEFGEENYEEANKLKNLVTLCPLHHRRVEMGLIKCP